MATTENLYSGIVESIFQNDFSVALLGVLIILALWMAVRYFIKSKSRIGIKSHQVPISAVIKRPSQAMIDNAPTVAATLPNKVAEEATDDDSILEEAELYSNHGRPAGAIKILLEVINRHPSKAAAWSLLLSNYSSLGQVDEFEKTAREFLKHHNSSPLWNGIQALGRTLDRDNPLYDSNNGNAYSSPPLLPDAANPRRAVGDILIEMGVLSEEDMQSWLDIYDPIKHGRFGGYLLAHRVITLAQLDQALLQQQR